MTRNPYLTSTAAAAISTSAIVASLVLHLKRKGVLSDEDEREIYELALVFLEQGQRDDADGVFEMAREVIEEHLREKN